MLENLFKLRENDTDVKTEIIAGFTTFMTMAYIIIVNPMILSGIEGISFEAIFFATIAGAVLGTLCMAFLTNYPFALASGMGLNAFFVAMVTQISNLTWQIALGIILIEGVLFIILSILPVREMIVNAIPISLKSGISAGIGLFIALIGLENAGIIIGTAKVIEEDPELVLEGGIGLTSQLFTGSALIALIGLVIIGVLHAKKVKGSIFVGIIITSVVAWILNGLGWVSLPNMSVGFFEWPNFSEWGTVFFKMDVAGAVKGILDFSLIGVLFAFLFVDMFDTAGTLVGVGQQGGYVDEDGNLPKAGNALLADAIGTTGGAIFGTSTVTSYIESSAGVAEGGRTGLTGVVVAILFAIAIFFAPLFGMIPGAATAPALIIVGIMMLSNITKIDWEDFTELLPAFMTMFIMPLSGSISDGIAVGFILYPLVKLLSGKGKKVHWLVYLLGVLFIAYFIWIVPVIKA